MLSDLDAGWLWAIGGILLLILEMFAPGVFLIFIGVAAIATGGFTLLFDLNVPAQLGLFAIYSGLAVAAGRRFYANRDDDGGSSPHLNDRPAQLVGRTALVIEPVDEHGGRVRLGDSEWTARGGPAAGGERVRITGVDGNCLRVEVERTLSNS